MSQIAESDIHNNKVDLNGCLFGMYFINNNSAKNRVSNNWFYGKLVSGGVAVHMAASNFTNYVHNNTFAISGPSNIAAIYAMGYPLSTPKRLSNFSGNVVTVIGGGLCAKLYTSFSGKYGHYVGDGNVFFCPAGSIGSDGLGKVHKTLASWTAATGQEKNSKLMDPQLVSISAPYDLHIKPASPAIDSSKNNPTWLTTDYHGEARGSAPDCGADEIVVKSFGVSCKGTGSQSPIQSHEGEWKLGTVNFQATVSNAPAATVAVAFFGFSNKAWGATPLPIKLPGSCEVATSMDLIFGAITDAKGVAKFPMSIPLDVRFAGLRLFTQAFVVDKGALLGFTLSNGLSLDT